MFESLPGEKWAKIRRYQHCHPMYAVSSLGRVVKVYPDKWELVKQYVHEGYHVVNLQNQLVAKTWRVDELVADSFIGPQHNKRMYVTHKDDDKANNRLENLQWGKICRSTKKVSRRPNKILTVQDVRAMRLIRKRDRVTYTTLGERFGVATSTARNICKRQTWKDID